MKRLIHAIALIVVVTGALTIGSVAFARAVPDSRLSVVGAWFEDAKGGACDRPCILGIVPGRTTLQTALTSIRVGPLTYGLKPRVRRLNGIAFAGRELTVGFSDAQIVTEVRVAAGIRAEPAETAMQEALRAANLGQVVARLGTPDRFRASTFGYSAQYVEVAICIYYDGLRVEVCGERQERMGGDTPLRVNISDQLAFIAVYNERVYWDMAVRGAVAWPGFGRVEKDR
jgi:hypothetical protein